MAIRSGRFKGDASGVGLKIIDGKNALFRIFNSGDAEFTVQPRNNTSDNIIVHPDCSVDVKVTGVCTILSAGDISGSYDYLGSSSRSRSGRLTGDASTAVKIVQGATDCFYRVLNSGKGSQDFVVEPAGVTLKPTFSLDVSTGGDIWVEGADVECLYEIIRGASDLELEEQELRSGRFRIRNTTGAYPHTIIHLSGGGGNGWYRLYNSGDEPIKLLRNGTLFAEVASDCSFDFDVKSNRDISVEATDPSALISGIYDYLGEPD
jgi:hypothetical protein